MTVVGHRVGGAQIGSERSFASHDPATSGEIVGRYALAGPREVAAAVDAARAAQPSWTAMGAIARGAVIREAGRIAEQRADALAEAIAREVGKPVSEARAEVLRAAVTLFYVAEQARAPSGATFESDDPSAAVMTFRRPVGVAGVITPWNFPFNLPAWKIAPALVHGNAVVWKPAEQSPFVAALLADVFHDAGLPPGVLNVVFGDGAAGAALTDAGLDALSFTGSTAVGREITRTAGAAGVRLQMELGGKNPLLVLEDADLDLATSLIVAGATSYAGQKCSATSRVIAVGRIADALVERVAAGFAALTVGDPREPDTQVGPLIDAGARDRALTAVRGSVAEGADLVSGGVEVNRPGWFMEPALLDRVAPDHRLADDEVFAPVVAVQRAADRAEAVALANRSRFGFFAGICTRDLGALTALAPALQFGILRINTVTTGADPHIPFGGWKASGNLVPEQGLAAREFFTRIQSVYVR